MTTPFVPHTAFAQSQKLKHLIEVMAFGVDRFGMHRAYGYKDEAEYVRQAMTRNVETSNFREYFNPETGQGMGAKWFTWGTLLLDMQD
jgi:hypothetical protein